MRRGINLQCMMMKMMMTMTMKMIIDHMTMMTMTMMMRMWDNDNGNYDVIQRKERQWHSGRGAQVTLICGAAWILNVDLTRPWAGMNRCQRKRIKECATFQRKKERSEQMSTEKESESVTFHRKRERFCELIVTFFYFLVDCLLPALSYWCHRQGTM